MVPLPNSTHILLTYTNPYKFLTTFLKALVLDNCLLPALPIKQVVAMTGAKR